MTTRDRFELDYSRRRGHVVRSALLFHRNQAGRYSNRSLQVIWQRYLAAASTGVAA